MCEGFECDPNSDWVRLGKIPQVYVKLKLYIYNLYYTYNHYISGRTQKLLFMETQCIRAAANSSVTELLPSTAEAPSINHQHGKNILFYLFFKNSVSLFTFTV